MLLLGSFQRRIEKFTALLILSVVMQTPLHAETGEQAWLRYARLDAQISRKYDGLPATVVKIGSSALLDTSQAELIHGISGMLGRNLRVEPGVTKERAILLGTFSELRNAVPGLSAPRQLRADSLWLTSARVK